MMKKQLRRLTLWVVIIFIGILGASVEEQSGLKKSEFRKINITPGDYSLYNINRIAGWNKRDGFSGNNPYTQRSGVWYPRGTATVIFADGLMWGGVPDTSVKKLPRVGGSTYISGWQPGRIISTGVAPSPNDPAIRIYRIRGDWQSASFEELRQDAAELWNTPPEEVNEYQVEMLRNLYQKDWEEWPTDWGAPFYDLNGNGTYEPEQGETPGLLGADQVLWFVVNDLDADRMLGLYGSLPVGLEMQVTKWAYRDSGAVGDAVFQRYILVNKSVTTMDSMFISYWMDVDVGDYTDDLVGCDSLLNLAYAYNGNPVDEMYQQFGLPPAAIGCVLLEGPKGENSVPLPMTSFAYFASGSNIADPKFHNYTGTRQWYMLMNGFTPNWDPDNPTVGEPYLHLTGPLAGRPTRFPFNGDPLSGLGDLDGQRESLLPGARRMALSSGPFRLAPGDTQTVTLALVGGSDPRGDYLSAVQALKKNVRNVIQFYKTDFFIPEPEYRVEFPDNSHSRFVFKVNLTEIPDVQSARLMGYSLLNDEPDFELQLFDDGAHNDSLAGDGIWGNGMEVTNRKHPYGVDLVVQSSSKTQEYQNIIPRLTLRPAPSLLNWRVVWENGRPDGRINQGEKVHLIFDIFNPDGVNPIENFKIFNFSSNIFHFTVSYSGVIPPGGQVSLDSSTYLELWAPQSGEQVELRFREFWDHQFKNTMVSLPLIRWKPNVMRGDTLPVEIVSGSSRGVVPVVTSPSELTGHRYAISFTGDVEQPPIYWRLYDLTLGRRLLNDIPVAEDDRTDFPIVDGIEWRVFTPPAQLLAVVEVANQDGPLPPEEWDETGAPYHGNNVWQDPSASSDVNRFLISTVSFHGWDALLDISPGHSPIPYVFYDDYEIRFTDEGGIYVWWYEDDSWDTVPFEVWDVGSGTYQDTTDDVRALTGGFSGYTATGSGGFRYDFTDPFSDLPATDWIEIRVPLDSLGSYERFYQDVTGGAPTLDWWEHSVGVLKDIIFCDYAGNNVLPASGTIIRFITGKASKPGDSLLVQAPTAHRDSLYGLAVSYQLSQNYPNPFNSTTTIYYSVAGEEHGSIEGPPVVHVKMEIFNVLGQRVKTLVDENIPEGEYLVRWDGTNQQGTPLASGVYILRMTAGGKNWIRKMVLIR